MKARTYILLVAALCFASSVMAQEQGQSQGSTQSLPQGASMMPASSADTQGIRKYLLGPGDTLDVRVFGQ
jgi:protein involved in polysaccharide export with SLBB domain